ncbi:branched-chain amino acid transport system ATP-binding protein [Hydrogenispora ethanolica]|uniref:Branched-chain amino acid transport system ATP-binding protein n=1 Tax=Hydrogenispora ethanolica TaxID=1082276 RepID=A0A4R1R8Z1_HYDET|nr:ABC transporter ATP-binding protein [Hydrogenispora ethanolica]TCL62154.1 branched-chain amino acid transport system ATP-binding protein [Hydrogenispora ethanolica]
MGAILRLEQINKAFGGLTAVANFGLELSEREIRGIIGPNGAGKTTIFNLISGVYHPDSGRIYFAGTDITAHAADAIARAGIARTFQNIRLFAQMSVMDNIRMAFHSRTGYHFWDSLIHSGRFRRAEERIRRESLEYLDRFGLADRGRELARNLSYGEQRRLEIARALATNPRVLLLDEPAAGMNPKEVEDLIQFIRNVHRDFPLAILLIEHQMPVVMELCGLIQVIDFGQTIAEGDPATVTNHPLVIRAYLGEEEATA